MNETCGVINGRLIVFTAKSSGCDRTDARCRICMCSFTVIIQSGWRQAHKSSSNLSPLNSHPLPSQSSTCPLGTTVINCVCFFFFFFVQASRLNTNLKLSFLIQHPLHRTVNLTDEFHVTDCLCHLTMSRTSSCPSE